MGFVGVWPLGIQFRNFWHQLAALLPCRLNLGHGKVHTCGRRGLGDPLEDLLPGQLRVEPALVVAVPDDEALQGQVVFAVGLASALATLYQA